MEESDHHEIYVSCRCQLKTGAKTEVDAHEREFIFLDHEHRDTHPPFNKGVHSAVFTISQHACLAQMPISKGILNCHACNLYYSNQTIHILAKHLNAVKAMSRIKCSLLIKILKQTAVHNHGWMQIE
jgi:hypothetical protein